MKVFGVHDEYRCGQCGNPMFARVEPVGDDMELVLWCVSRSCPTHGKRFRAKIESFEAVEVGSGGG